MANEYSGSIAQVATDYAALYRSQRKSQLDLDTESFLQLIVAQIQNQDVLGSGESGSSSNSGDYVNQLLQMTLVQSISDMMEMSTTSYAMSMVGKEVVVASVDGTKVETVQGIVSGVSIYGDEPILHVDGKEYKLSQVMTVGSTETKASKTETLLEEILNELKKPEAEDEDEDAEDTSSATDTATDAAADTAADTAADASTGTEGGSDASA